MVRHSFFLLYVDCNTFLRKIMDWLNVTISTVMMFFVFHEIVGFEVILLLDKLKSKVRET